MRASRAYCMEVYADNVRTISIYGAIHL